jgi:hypothetical protein
MSYADTYKLIIKAQETKPPMWQPCNQCGWCCLTEVCPTGIELTGSSEAPCSLLKQDGDRHLCLIAKGNTSLTLSIGTGCDAATGHEMISGTPLGD